MIDANVAPSPAPAPSDAHPFEPVFAVLESMRDTFGQSVMDLEQDEDDWATKRHRVEIAADELLGKIVPQVQALPEHEDRAATVRFTQQLIAGAAARLVLVGAREKADTLVRAGAALGEEPLTAYLRDASRSWDAFVEIERARAAAAFDDQECDRRLKKTARRKDLWPAAKDEIERILDRPREVVSPPSIFWVYGLGAMLLGRRDAQPNGIHRTTRFILLTIIPVWPTGDYLVKKYASSVTYYAQYRLPKWARIWQKTVLALAAVGAVVLGVSLYFSSDGYQLKQMIAEAEAAEIAGDAEQALERYERALREGNPRSPQMHQVAASVMRIRAEAIQRPVTAASVAEIRAVVDTYDGIPRGAREPVARDTLAAHLVEWANEIGMETPATAQATRVVAALGTTVAPENDELQALRVNATLAVASELEADWPLDALSAYVGLLPSPEAQAKIDPLLERLTASPAVLYEHRALVNAARGNAPTELSNAIEEGLADVARWNGNPARATAIERGGGELLAWVTTHRRDQEAAVARAENLRAAGDSAGALAVLERAGSPGESIEAGHVLRADLLIEAGRSEQALALLRRYVERHLEPYLQAVTSYDRRAMEKYEQLAQRAENGTLPDSVMNRLLAIEDEEEVYAEFDRYAQEQLENDTELAGLREQIVEHADAVSASMLQGSLALELAMQTTGAARQELLLEAEAAFLAIRAEAGESAGYRTQLGMVYHRLGRPEEGDAEFDDVVRLYGPEWDIEVASAYRELGLDAKATELAQAVADASEDEAIRGSASVLLAMMATTDEERAAAIAIAPDNDQNRLLADEVRAQELIDQGDLAGAAAVFLRIANEWESEVESATAANNAAVAYGQRFVCTGDIEDAEKAAAAMERAARLEPSSAIVAQNAAEALFREASARVLSEYVDLGELGTDIADLDSLLNVFVAGPHGGAIRDALAGAPRVSASTGHLRRAITLAPGNTSLFTDLCDQLVLLRDLSGLQRLNTSLASTGYVPGANPELEMYRAGLYDALVLEMTNTGTEARTARLASSRLSSRSRDVLRVYQARDLMMRMSVTGYWEDASGALEHLDAVDDDALPVTDGTLRTVIALALARAAAESAELGAVYEDMRRNYSPGPLLALRIIEEHPSLAAAIRADEAMARVPALLDATERPSVDSWAAATVLGDTQRATAHASYRENPVTQASRSIRHALADTNDYNDAWIQELWER